MLKASPTLTDVEYPESDGEPMAETDTHRVQMTDALIYPLKERYRHRLDVYVSGNLFLYYEEGNPSSVVAPDVFVVFGVPDQLRRIYKLWEEKKAPDVVFELTSRKTYQEDLSKKRLLYEELGVREYFLIDPLREYLRPPLQGFRLVDDYYVPVMPEQLDNGEWQTSSEVLELILRTEGPTLRLYDPEQKRYLPMPAEEAQIRRQAETRATIAETRAATAEARAAEEAKARRAAEAEVERLRALLAQQDQTTDDR